MGAGNYARLAIFSGVRERRAGDSATGNEVEERRVVPDLARVRNAGSKPFALNIPASAGNAASAAAAAAANPICVFI